jgi:hypothetical protein
MPFTERWWRVDDVYGHSTWTDQNPSERLTAAWTDATVAGPFVMEKPDDKFIAKVVPRSAGNGSEPFQCRIYNHPNQTLVPDGIYERVGGDDE